MCFSGAKFSTFCGQGVVFLYSLQQTPTTRLLSLTSGPVLQNTPYKMSDSKSVRNQLAQVLHTWWQEFLVTQRPIVL